MSIGLPLSVENYLLESGFAASEILVLKKLLDENLLTMRELAAKTGKGNGVIDGALKKLVRRNLVTKEHFNEHPKYKVIDPQSIVAWAKKNLKEHTDMMERKHESFVHFMKNMSVEKNHPDIEHFFGENGFMKAYDKLLENRTELLTYIDPASIADNDPLANFRMQFSRRRQVHGVFQRVIAPDSPLARRFRTRDPFEYRKTILVPPEIYPFSFEKIIAGDTVACLDMKSMEASFIRFEKLAESERKTFERLWNEQLKHDDTRHQRNDDSFEESTNHFRYHFTINILQKICVAALFADCLFWMALFITNSRGGFYNYIYGGSFGLIPFFSGIIGILRTKIWGGLKTAIGKAIFLTSIGLVLWGCGSFVWSYHNFALDIEAPYPGLGDLFWVPSEFFYSIGAIFFASATGAKFGLRNIYGKIFTVIAPIIILCVSYYAFITIARGGALTTPGGTTAKMILDIAYPFGDFLGLTIAILISGLSFKYMGGKFVFEILSILFGLAVMFVADFVFSYTTTVGTFYNGNFGDLLYTFGLFFLSFGVLGFSKEKTVLPQTLQMPAPINQLTV